MKFHFELYTFRTKSVFLVAYTDANKIKKKVVCPNFGQPTLDLRALQATKVENHHSEAETISKLTVHYLKMSLGNPTLV